MTRRTICVFCGSRTGARPDYLRAASELGTELGRAGMNVVYGGAGAGLMGAVADAALAAGSEVIGIIPRAFEDQEIAHKNLTRLEVVDSLLTRKARMAELADGFAVLPGGGGTLDELFEMFTWSQLGLHQKPIVLVRVGDYYRALEEWLDMAIAEGFVDEDQRRLLTPADGPVQAVGSLRVALGGRPIESQAR